MVNKMLLGLQYRAHLPPRWNDISSSSLSPLRPSTDLTRVFTTHATGDIVTPTKTYKNVNFLFEYTPSLTIEPPAPLLRQLGEADFSIPPMQHKIFAAHPITFYSSGWFFKGIHKLEGYKGVDVGFSTVPFEDEGRPWWGEYWDASMRPYYNVPPEWAFAEDARSYLYTGNPADPKVAAPALIPSYLFDHLRYFIRFFDTVYILKPTEYTRRRFYRFVEEDLPSIMRILQGLSWLEEIDAPDYLKNVPISNGGVFLNISLGYSYFLGAEVLGEGEGGAFSPSDWILPTPSFFPEFLQSSTQEAFLENATWKYSPNSGYYPPPPDPTWYPVWNFDVKSVGLSLLGFINLGDVREYNADGEWLNNLLTYGGHFHTFASYTTGYYDSYGNWIMPPFVDVPTPLLVWSGTSGSFIIGNIESEDAPAETVTRVFLHGIAEYVRRLGNIRYKLKLALTSQVRLAFLPFRKVKESAKVYAPPKKETIARAVHPYFEVEDVFTFPYLVSRGRRAQFKPRDYVRHAEHLRAPETISSEVGDEKITGAIFSAATLPTGETSNVHIWGDDVPTHNLFVDNISARWKDYNLGRSTREWIEGYLLPTFQFAVSEIKKYFIEKRFVHSRMPRSDVTCTSLRTLDGSPSHNLPISVTTEKEIIRLGDYTQKVGVIYRMPSEMLEGKCKVKRYIVGGVPVGMFSVAPDYEGSFTQFFKTLGGKGALVTDYPITWSPKLVNFSGGVVSPPELQFIPMYLVRERPSIAISTDLLYKQPQFRETRETRFIFLEEQFHGATPDETKQFYYLLLQNTILRPLVETEFALFEFNVNANRYIVKRYTFPIIVSTAGTFSVDYSISDTRNFNTYSVSTEASGKFGSHPLVIFSDRQEQSWLLWKLAWDLLFSKDRERPILNIDNYNDYAQFWNDFVDTLWSEAMTKTGKLIPKDTIVKFTEFFFRHVLVDFPGFGDRVLLEDVIGWARPRAHHFAPSTSTLSLFSLLSNTTTKKIYPDGRYFPIAPSPVGDPVWGKVTGTENGFQLNFQHGNNEYTSPLMPTHEGEYIHEVLIPQGRRARFRIKKNLVTNTVDYSLRPMHAFALSSYMTYAPLVPPTIEFPQVFFSATHDEPLIRSVRWGSGARSQILGSFSMSAVSSATAVSILPNRTEFYLHTSLGHFLKFSQTVPIPYHQLKRSRVVGDDALWGTVLFNLRDYMLQPLPLEYFRCYDIPLEGALRSVERYYGNVTKLSASDFYKYGDNPFFVANYKIVPEEFYVRKEVPLVGVPVLLKISDDEDIILYHPPHGAFEDYAYETVYTTHDGYRIGYFRETGQGIEPSQEGSINRGYSPQISQQAWEEIWLEGGKVLKDGIEFSVHRLEPRHPFHPRVYLLIALPERVRPSFSIVTLQDRPVHISMYQDTFHEIIPIKCKNALNTEDKGLIDFLVGEPPTFNTYYDQLKEFYPAIQHPLLGVKAYKELRETIPEGLQALKDLVSYFPEHPNEKVRQEEHLSEEETERFNNLKDLFFKVYGVPMSALLSPYYGWDDEAENAIEVERKWKQGESLGLKERAAITLLVMPKYPTLSFPFVLDSAEGEKLKLLGYVRTPPATPTPPTQFPYILFYLHALRTLNYEYVKQTKGIEMAERVAPPFYPFDLIPVFVYDYLHNFDEYKEMAEKIEKAKKLVGIRWSELLTTIFIYPHVPSVWEREFSVAPMLVKEYVSSFVDFQTLKTILASLLPTVFELTKEIAYILGRGDPIMMHGRPRPVTYPTTFSVDIDAYYVPTGGAPHSIPSVPLSFLYTLSPLAYKVYESETFIGKIQRGFSPIPIQLVTVYEGLGDPLVYNTSINTLQQEICYGNVIVDITTPLIALLPQISRNLTFLFERFVSERGIIIGSAEISKAYDDVWTIVNIGEYRQHLVAPVWGAKSASDAVFKWHFDRRVDVLHISLPVLDGVGQAPEPKSIYPLLDRLTFPEKSYPYEQYFSVPLVRQDFTHDVVLRSLETYLCAPPHKFPTVILGREKYRLGNALKEWILPFDLQLRYKLTRKFSNTVVEKLLEVRKTKDLLSFLLFTGRFALAKIEPEGGE